MNKPKPDSKERERKEVRFTVFAELHKRIRIAAAEAELTIAEFVEGLLETAMKERR